MSYTSDLIDPTLEEVCQVLKLDDYLPTFQREEFTFADLLLLSDEDLAGLKLPMGPRRRLMTYLRDLEIRRSRLKMVRGRKECSVRVATLPQSIRLLYIHLCYSSTRFQQNWHRHHSAVLFFCSSFLFHSFILFHFCLNAQQEGGNIPAHNSTVGYTVGLAGTGQPSISYPTLEFSPAAFYALGSPTGNR